MRRGIDFLLISLFVINILMSGCTKREIFNDPADPAQGSIDQPGNGNGTEILSGSIHGDLLLKNSPFKVSGNIVVDSLQDLNIEAGVKIIFRENASLTVRGRLKSNGRSDRFITFTSEGQSWKGIQFINSSGLSVILYSIFENIDVYTQLKDSLRISAFELTGSKGIIRNAVFRNNKSKNGGALYSEGSAFNISNSIFINNFASVFGGAIISVNSSNRIINNTFKGNEGFNYGGGLVLINPVNEEVQNNIFYKNRSRTGDLSIAVKGGQSENYLIKYNFTDSAVSDPLFISDTDLRLRPGSPCINAGNPAPEFNDVDGSRNDQGAYGGPMGFF